MARAVAALFLVVAQVALGLVVLWLFLFRRHWLREQPRGVRLLSVALLVVAISLLAISLD